LLLGFSAACVSNSDLSTIPPLVRQEMQQSSNCGTNWHQTIELYSSKVMLF
jgi:hypothetical protein